MRLTKDMKGLLTRHLTFHQKRTLKKVAQQLFFHRDFKAAVRVAEDLFPEKYHVEPEIGQLYMLTNSYIKNSQYIPRESIMLLVDIEDEEYVFIYNEKKIRMLFARHIDFNLFLKKLEPDHENL